MKRSMRFILPVLLVAAIAGCSSAGATPTAEPTPTPAPTPTASPTPTPTPAATATPTATPTPAATPTPTPTPGPPAAPTAVKMTDLTPPATCPAAFGASCFAHKVTWTETDSTGVTITVYAVTKCLAKPHCLLTTTVVPAANMYSLGSAAASKGELSFVVGDGESNGDGWVKSGATTLYLYAVVVQASSVNGKSSTVIAWTW
jgi:hypothetical protein